MSTFSINISTNTESVAYPLVTFTDVDNMLLTLIDNNSKLINPWDLRSSVLSLYSSAGFKLTTPSTSIIEYIGIDTLNPSSRDEKKPILIGKRAFSSTYSYVSTHDIFTTFTFSSLDNDVYFYNTKRDTVNNDETKLSVLAGTAPSLYTFAPYIRAQTITSTSSLSLDIINPSVSGNINLSSIYGTVSFNNVVFPTYINSFASASNTKTFFYEDGKLVWGDIVYPPLSYIGMTGVDLQIYGLPVNINNYPLEFTDSRNLPKKINDMLVGRTFSRVPISEIIKLILYPYLNPLCSIKILPPYDSGVVEVGTFPVPTVQYTVTKRTLSTFAATLTNMLPSVFPAITSPGIVTQTGNSTGIVISPITTATTSFTINVSDGTQSSSATTTLNGVYPFFYGYSSLSSMTTIGLAALNKLIEPKSDKNLPVSGSGNLFFIYDVNYGTLSNIYDYFGNTASGSFSTTTQFFSSPTGLWAAKQFRVYKYLGAPTISPGPLNFQFQF